MTPDEPVTMWIAALQQGDEAAVARIWERYRDRLRRVARRVLRGSRRRAADEDDVLQNAFMSFWRGAARGRFANLRDRRSLRLLLQRIVQRQAINHLQHERRQKRGGGALRGESAITGPDGRFGSRSLEQVAGEETPPDLAAASAEAFQRFLSRLPDDALRQIALLKMEGRTNPEIARRLSCSRATVARRLELIRALWRDEIEP